LKSIFFFNDATLILDGSTLIADTSTLFSDGSTLFLGSFLFLVKKRVSGGKLFWIYKVFVFYGYFKKIFEVIQFSMIGLLK
jgi:hypothetical protein